MSGKFRNLITRYSAWLVITCRKDLLLPLSKGSVHVSGRRRRKQVPAKS